MTGFPHNVTVEQIAARCNRSIDIVQAWYDGDKNPPPYFELTCIAVANGWEPATPERMAVHPSLAETLSAHPESVRYWHKTLQYPMAARLAVAAIDRAISRPPRPADTLTSYDVSQLGRIIVNGPFYRVRNGWRARAAIGSPVAAMRLDTPAKLIRLGYAQVSAGKLTATEKGRKRWFIH